VVEAFQRWLRARKGASDLLWPFPLAVLEPSYAWVFRVMGLLALFIWAAAVLGVYCFFHGADLPPVRR
jgi:hypothetical protein